MAPVDWIIVAAYFAFALGVGIFFTRRASKSMKEFFISGRNLPWWLAGTSMVATSFASDTPLFITGIVRKNGVAENWLWWSFAIGGMLTVFVFSRWWRRAEVITDVELAELRYGGPSAKILRLVNGLFKALVVNVKTMAWVICGMVIILSVIVDMDENTALLVCLAVALVYSLLSGFWGVVVTDLVQFALAMTGSIALAVIALGKNGGISGLKAGLAKIPGGMEKLNFFPSAVTEGTFFSGAFWECALVTFFVYVFVLWWTKNADGNAAVIQRINASKNEKHAFGATLFFQVVNNAIRPWPWILVALISIVVFPKLPQGYTNDELAYPLMMREYLPAGLKGVMIASLLAAFMSTIDTYLNLSAAYLVNDVYRRFLVKARPEGHYVLASRIAVLVVMILAAGIAMLFGSIIVIFKLLIALMAGFGPVILARWFWWRINAWSEISAMAASIAINIVFLAVAPKFPFAAKILIVVSGSASVWLLVTFLTRPVEMEQLSKFYRRVRPLGFWGPVARANPDVQPDGGWLGAIASWIAGFVMVFSLTFAIGKFLLAEPGAGLYYLGAFLVSGAFVVWSITRKK